MVKKKEEAFSAPPLQLSLAPSPTSEEEEILPRREIVVSSKLCSMLPSLVKGRVMEIGGERASVLYPVRLSSKANPEKVYVHSQVFEVLKEYLGGEKVELRDAPQNIKKCEKAGNIFLSYREGDDINDYKFQKQKFSSKDFIFSPTFSYISQSLNGAFLHNGEPLPFSLGGKVHFFCAFKEAGVGPVVFSPECRISFKDPKEEEVFRNPQKASKSGGLFPGFSKLGGLAPQVQELKSLVLAPLKNPQKFKNFGLDPPRGVLIYGAPGTGKSLLLGALEEEVAPFAFCSSLNANELLQLASSSPSPGEAVQEFFSGLRREGEEAKGGRGVVFVDDVDLLCTRRDEATDEEKKVSAAFLREMEKGEADFLFVGATNKVKKMDPSSRGAGKFEREVELGVPDLGGRVEILKCLLRNKKSNLSGGDLQRIGQKTHGFVGADLASLVNNAVFLAFEEEEGRVEKKGEEVEDAEVFASLPHFDAALEHVQPSALRELLVEVPKTNWEDIGGYQHVKQCLQEAVSWPTSFQNLFEALSVSPPRGVLMYGPPGCAKTLMAKAVATESDMNFISVKGPELFSKWVGSSEQAVRDLFRKARQASPCVVFIDECDALGGNRDAEEGGGGGGAVGSRVLAQLLTELDGVSSSKHVVLLAATNRPQALDPALLRPGRLDRLVYVGLPDQQARKEIFTNFFKKSRSTLSPEQLHQVAALSEGYTGAECVMVCREAAMTCIRKTITRSLPREEGRGLRALSGKEEEEICRKIENLSLDSPKKSRKTKRIDEEDLGSGVGWEDLEGALRAVQPRIDKETIQKYLDYEKTIKKA